MILMSSYYFVILLYFFRLQVKTTNSPTSLKKSVRVMYLICVVQRESQSELGMLEEIYISVAVTYKL